LAERHTFVLKLKVLQTTQRSLNTPVRPTSTNRRPAYTLSHLASTGSSTKKGKRGYSEGSLSKGQDNGEFQHYLY